MRPSDRPDSERMRSVAIYPGSFDPPTFGHMDIIRRAAALYERLIVAAGNNPDKQYLFPVETRLAMLRDCCSDLPGVVVESFEGLLVEFARRQGASVIVKGLRAISDFDYEFQMAVANRMLDGSVETVFLMTSQEYAYLSSSIVKQIGAMGGDVSSLVPACVERRLRERLQSL
ncbi:MAG: phosphopantetheine adenylyltransferase [Fimbriimonadales bacterium]